MRKPLVSICIPTFKQVYYLRICLQSVIEQDLTDYELIVSDDTPDDSVKTLVYDVLKNREFKYFKNNPSLGSPVNWNKAIAEAKGTYIKLLHHDDFFLHSSSLRTMVEQIQKTNADFLFCESRVWYPERKFSRIHSLTYNQLEQLENNIDHLLFCNCIGSPSATLHRNDSSICYDERLIWLVDVDYYINYIKAHRLLTFVNQPLICTTHGIENQITTSVVENKVIQVKEHVLVFLKNCIDSKYTSDYSKLFDCLFSRFSVNSYDELLMIVPEAAVKEYFFQQIFANNKHILRKIRNVGFKVIGLVNHLKELLSFQRSQ